MQIDFISASSRDVDLSDGVHFHMTKQMIDLHHVIILISNLPSIPFSLRRKSENHSLTPLPPRDRKKHSSNVFT